MTQETISVRDLADQVGKRKQTIFKILTRLGIHSTKVRSSGHRGQRVAHITVEQARLVHDELNSRANSRMMRTENHLKEIDISEGEVGCFYLIALEPEHDPGRFKVGFALGLEDRVRHLRCSAPLLKVVKQWPCKRLWEKTTIDAVTLGCQQLHTEVFRTDSIETVVKRCDQFFALMPKL